MHLDIVTLLAANSFVAGLGGLLLMGAWTQIRGAPSLLWWSAANFVAAIGIGLLAYGKGTGAELIVAAGATLASLSPALVWAGTRTFVNRRPWALLAGSGALWLAAGALSHGSERWSTVVGFAAWIGYLLASNWELWRARSEPLMARWPLMAFFSLHALIFAGGVYDTLFLQIPGDRVPPLNSWFGLIHVEALVYAIATALFMVVMCKERSELGYINTAQLDALTGIANRGAFFVGAQRLLDRCRKEGLPSSVIAFDLDLFKSVNDTHGHAVGDRVLRIFAEAAQGVLRPNDFFGRHGGEEFAVVLPGATIETAYVIADRVRHAFAEACRDVDGLLLYATVSGGVAAASSPDFTVAMEAADRALYRAKNHGRNRVERSNNGRSDEPSNLIRVA